MFWIPAVIGGLASLIGGIQQSQRASEALGLQREQLELARQLQDYILKRQALVDPIFQDLLSQALFRANTAPFFAGQRHSRVSPIFGALRGGRVPLPPPKLIGS